MAKLLNCWGGDPLLILIHKYMKTPPEFKGKL